MYEEFIKRLRMQADVERFYSGEPMLYDQAADVIEELQQTVEHYKGCSDDWYKEACDYKSMLPRWIPVTERLPEDREMVIGFTPCDGFMFVGFHVTSLYHDRDFSYWNIVTAMRSTKQMTKKVTHWMPLPEPPKEE